MAVPTTTFRQIPSSTLATAVDTPAKRIATITGETIVSTGTGNELDFGIIDISAGGKQSSVLTFLWTVTASGGNTTVDSFKYWVNAIGFDNAGSVVKIATLSGADQTTPVNTENYITNATTASYTFATAPEVEPGLQNVYPSDEGTSMTVATTSDDAIMLAVYLDIAASETTGIYKGLDAGKELQTSFKYAYS